MAVIGWALTGFAPQAVAQTSPTSATTYTVTHLNSETPTDGCSGIRVGDTIQWQPGSPPTTGTLTFHLAQGNQSWQLALAQGVDPNAPDYAWVTQNRLAYQPPRQDYSRFEHVFIESSGVLATLQFTPGGNSCVFQVAAGAASRPVAPPGSAGAPLIITMSCDTSGLQNAGQANCTAGVVRQPPNARISYSWTVDGQVQPGVTGTVIRLSGLRPGKHQVDVIARDTAGNVPSNPQTASFTRTALRVGLACDTNDLNNSGDVLCTAAVSDQASHAAISYEWRVDGQLQPGVTGSALALAKVAVGEHKVSVTARDTVNNVDAGPETAAFTRSPGVAAPPPPSLGPGPPPPGGDQGTGSAPSPTAFPIAPVTAGAGGAVALALVALAGFRAVRLRRRACEDLIPRARHLRRLMDDLAQKQAEISEEWTTYKTQRDYLEKLRAEIDGACEPARNTVFHARVFNWTSHIIWISGVGAALAALYAAGTATAATTAATTATTAKIKAIWAAFAKLATVSAGVYTAYRKDSTPSGLSPHPFVDPWAFGIKRDLILGIREVADKYLGAAINFNLELDLWKARRQAEVNRIEDEIHKDAAALAKDRTLCPTCQATDQPDSRTPTMTEIVPPYVSKDFTDDWLQNL